MLRPVDGALMRPTSYSEKDPQFLHESDARMKNMVHYFLAQPFLDWFMVQPAMTKPQKERCFRIRHQVYCEEMHFLPETKSKLETDAFDADAMHLLMLDRRENEPIGSIRIIQGPDVPMNKEHGVILEPGNYAELSRLVVLNTFRKRKGEFWAPAGISDHSFQENRENPERKPMGVGSRLPHIPMGLFLASLSWAQFKKIDTLYFLAEPRIAQYMAKIGVTAKPIGPGIELHGLRSPYRISVTEAIDEIKSMFKPMFREINGQMVQQLLERKTNVHDDD